MKLCISRSRGSAVELVIPYVDSVLVMKVLILASIECPRLKILQIYSQVHHRDENQLPDLISKWKELEILKITWKPISIVEILEQISLNCPNFIGLHLYGLMLCDVESRAIVRFMPRLKILVIRNSIIHKVEDLIMILENCKELELLDASNCAGFDVDDEILMKTSKIKRFECEGTTKKGSIMHALLVDKLRVAGKYRHLQ